MIRVLVSGLTLSGTLLCSQVLAAGPTPTTREMAEQLRRQQQTIDRLQGEIETLRRQAQTLDAIEQSRRSLEQQQLEVRQLLEKVDSADKASQKRDADLQEQVEAVAVRADEDRARAIDPVGKLQWSGYGVINYQRYDWFQNAQATRGERRARTDLERFVIAPRYDFGNGLSFHAEIEFEHGGTGSAIEFETEEAGEFESEIEKGGEVMLEHAYLQWHMWPALNWRFGELVVPFGMINTHHQPTQYFTLERSLAETSLIPSVWHETGLEAYGALGRLRYQFQLVSGLDSTGFSGYGFVSEGMQGRLEFRDATSPAVVARADYSIAPGVLVGGSYYFGDSRRNRARRNLDVSADLAMAEIHGRYERGAWTVRTQYLSARLQNADRVAQANLRTFNGDLLGVSRSPVGSRARSFFVEAGYNLLDLWPGRGDRLDLFARYETWDTQAATGGATVRNPRYDRTARTVGVNYRPQPGIVLKAEYSRRTHEGTIANRQSLFGLGLGVEF